MNLKYRRIVEKLTVDNYRELYKLGENRIKLVKQDTNKTTKITSICKKVLASLFTAVLLISCKSDQKTTDPNLESSNKESSEIVNQSASESSKKVILFYGNSLTAGFGLDPDESFPSLIENKIDSLDLPYQVVNAGLSGETTSGGLQRLDWVMNQQVDIFILELGPNDMLRGLPLDETRKNLRQIIEKVKAKNNNIKIGLCELLSPPNMGSEYAKEFQAIYSELAKELEVTLLPFFLEGVAGNSELLLPDGKHPNANGQVIVAKNIWSTLQTMI